MNPRNNAIKGTVSQKRQRLARACLAWCLVVSMLAPLFPVLTPTAFAAPTSAPLAQTTNTLTLNVVSARTESRHQPAAVAKGDPITQYKYIINIDNTGQTTQRTPADGCSPASPGYPSSCLWNSIAGTPGSSPIYTQGDQSDFNSSGVATLPSLANMPAGRYLISVLADGYKLDGAHFSVPLSGPVTVELQPHPLPDAMIRAFVFQDEAITNGAPDVPVEQGLAGFTGSLNDYLGQLTTDIYGNPLCTVYEGEDPVTHVIPDSALDSQQLPIPIPGTGGQCVSDANGMLAIPHLGTNRYALTVTPPNGTDWVQTTTLEGNHDWDAWIMEGSTGYDTEFVVAGEPFPTIIFGFVKPKTIPGSGGHHIKGSVDAAKIYVPAKGGLGLPGTIWGGMTGAKLDGPIDSPWLSLNDLNNGDIAIWVGHGNPDGTFDIPNVPDGNYTLTWWDEPQDYILDLVNVTVSGGDVNMGILPLTGWWTKIEGYVFNDLNRNGVKDAGEPGMANYTLTMRKRENSLMDRGATLVTTDANGYYVMENAYPMTQWLVEEAYNDLYYTTGVTYQADNQPTPTTVKGAGVDVSVLPIIGLGGRLDWGVHSYDPTGATCQPAGSYTDCLDPRNGGIVGTVSYDTTRNELDPRFAAVEDWQPGVSGLTVNLYATVPCNSTQPCDSTNRYRLAPDGSYLKGNLLNTYVTESWERPKGCLARDVDGNILRNGTDEKVLPAGSDQPGNTQDCLEGPLMGVQFGTYATDQGTPNANFGAAVDGNYGFGDGCFNADNTPGVFDALSGTCTAGSIQPLPGARDYLVEVEIPQDATGRPMYQFTREEDINIANGDQIIPQIPPPPCAGPLHTVDVANVGTDGYSAINLPNGVVVPPSAPVDNPTFLDIGASPYEGMQKPLCDTKLVTVSNGKSIVPTFNVFTDVPLPGRFWALIVDDLNFSADPKSLLYGEKAGVPFAPVGIYDYANRLVTTVESDFNGLFDVLLPSTNRISCPTPSGVCANLYRFVGNDPGIPGRLNPNYKPEFRTIAAEFEAFPGLIVPADLAPTQVGVTVQLPGGQINSASCALDAVTPQLFAVSKPYISGSGSFTIKGIGFGPVQGSGQVTLDGVFVMPVTSWNDTDIAVTVPATTPFGPHQLRVKAANGQSTINGLTFHVLGSGQGPAAFGIMPATGVLDTFERTSNTDFGGNWFDDAPDTVFNSVNPSVPNPTDGYGRVRTGANVYHAWWGNNNTTVYGNNQEAYFSFTQVANAAQQGLLLKFSGSTNNPNANGARWVEVAYNRTNTSVQIFAKTGNTPTLLQTINNMSFVPGDQLGARALADGTILAYKNGNPIGTAISAGLAANTGRIGIRFSGTGTTTATEARIDNFGGGTIVPRNYNATVYEVGPGRPYATIQSAIDAALTSPADDLVVVYPNQPDPNPRVNPRGAYYENLIISGPIKLQGVGPGGFQGNTFVPGSIIDGGAFGGDTALADAWRAKIATMVDPLTGIATWQGNPNINDGETIYLLAMSPNAYGTIYRASIDGFDLRGGDQQGFPGNINRIGGGPTGLPPNIVTQGGAIFANAYVRNLQITNNIVQNNGGGYGTIRIGTPDLPAPDTNQHNENVRIANNRIIANGGTNLAGGIGLFAGADNYEVAGNDICGNFSAEYGGGLTVYGLSPNGKIHDNRIYFNRSYDEGGGIMIAGELPARAGTLSPGTGPVDIYNNLIQANLGNDDGGGIRFLMAGGPGGTAAMNVYNNMIVNNVSTHEGGGISLNDAPNVRVYNNTIMKNLTTATAVTSLGAPAPAGLSTSRNSTMLQATLPGGSSIFSNPFLFNNIFWDNRAGTRAGATVTGLDLAGANYWDLGVADAPGLLAPTNSVIQQSTAAHAYTASPTNSTVDPSVIGTYDTSVAFSVWRNNPNFVGAILVAVDLPANLLGNYHLQNTSPAQNLGAASKTVGALTVNAPAFDIDNQSRPGPGGYDIGADEYPGNFADLSITKTDNQTSVVRGSLVTYNILVINNGPNVVNLATVNDNVPAILTGVTWTCVATVNSTCTAASGTGNTINTSVTLANGGFATFTVVGTLPANTTATTLVNTATVTAPAGVTDPNTLNNSATDTDTVTNPPADLSITKTDGQTTVSAGGQPIYSIVVTNNGPSNVTGATVADAFPAVLTVNAWSCLATAGSSCTAPTSVGNNKTGTVTLLSGGSATFTARTTVVANATGNLVNTATVVAPLNITDPNTANNSATDTDSIIPTLPTLNVLDNFNRGNANTLSNGTNWSQGITGGASAIRVNANQAFCTGTLCVPGAAYWNNPTGGFSASQGAAFTFANSPVNGSSLLLKASGGTAPALTNFIRVRYNAGQVIVESTTNSGASYTSLGSFAATFVNGDRLSAVANSNGSVDVWKTTGANVTSYIGHSAVSAFTGTGRIGMQLPNGARVDNFGGGNVNLIVVAIALDAATTFPQTALVDNFAVANGPLSTNWVGATATTSFRINGQRVESRSSTGGAIWWNTPFGGNQEAYMTLTKIGKSSGSTKRWQGLLLKLNGNAPDDVNASAIDVSYSSSDGVQVRSKAPGQGWVIQATFGGVTFANGDVLGASASGDGTVVAYKNGVPLGNVNVTSGPNPWPTNLAAGGGWIGATYTFSGGRFDNFGGGDAVAFVAAASVGDALGELQPLEENTSDVTTPDQADDIDVTDDPAVFDPEVVKYDLFIPAVGNTTTNSEFDQSQVSSADQEQRNNAVYLPHVANK